MYKNKAFIDPTLTLHHDKVYKSFHFLTHSQTRRFIFPIFHFLTHSQTRRFIFPISPYDG